MPITIVAAAAGRTAMILVSSPDSGSSARHVVPEVRMPAAAVIRCLAWQYNIIDPPTREMGEVQEMIQQGLRDQAEAWERYAAQVVCVLASYGTAQ